MLRYYVNFITSLEIYFTVDGKPLGLAMNKSLLPIHPVKAKKGDSNISKKVKTLVTTMLRANPRKRPYIDEVLKELTDIPGE